MKCISKGNKRCKPFSKKTFSYVNIFHCPFCFIKHIFSYWNGCICFSWNFLWSAIAGGIACPVIRAPGVFLILWCIDVKIYKEYKEFMEKQTYDIPIKIERTKKKKKLEKFLFIP